MQSGCYFIEKELVELRDTTRPGDVQGRDDRGGAARRETTAICLPLSVSFFHCCAPCRSTRSPTHCTSEPFNTHPDTFSQQAGFSLRNYDRLSVLIFELREGVVLLEWW